MRNRIRTSSGPDPALKPKGWRLEDIDENDAAFQSGPCPETEGMETAFQKMTVLIAMRPDPALKPKGWRRKIVPL